MVGVYECVNKARQGHSAKKLGAKAMTRHSSFAAARFIYSLARMKKEKKERKRKKKNQKKGV